MSNLSDQDRVDVETLWNYHVLDSGNVKADFLMVLGSHDLRVAEHAARIYCDGAAPWIVVAGGSGKVTQVEWNKPEAEVYAERMISLGVPSGRIVIERKSTNTGDNFSFSKDIVSRAGIVALSGIVVCKPYMARRALATAGKRWSEVAWSTRPPRVELWNYPTVDTPLERMINLMVGDLQRLDLYAVKGFQVPVVIPETVRESYRRLVGRGYDKFVISETASHGH
jgi:uncharacterized SAM-binding protein YcdF (DUF218 family)